jgi:translocator protein
MKSKSLIRLVVSLALPLCVGAIGGIITARSVPAWYMFLVKPSFSPPNWIFGPVWTILYILMGISLFLVWSREPSSRKTIAISCFFIQLALNFCWSIIFFYFRLIGLSFVEIIILWVSIATMMVLFYRIMPVAAYINIPYLLWVSFATVLNGALFVLN